MKVSSAIRKVMDCIVYSEMGGKIDMGDPYYPTFQSLDEMLQKVLDEEDMSKTNKKGA